MIRIVLLMAMMIIGFFGAIFSPLNFSQFQNELYFMAQFVGSILLETACLIYLFKLLKSNKAKQKPYIRIIK
jgi:hypothetical protein